MRLLAVAMLALTAATTAASHLLYTADQACQISLIESRPQNLTFNSTIQHRSTFDAYKLLVMSAKAELNFAQLYWTLRSHDVQPYFPELAKQGDELFALIANSSAPVKIAYNLGGFGINTSDVADLTKLQHVQAVGLNFTGLFGAGVLHTKMVIADRRHAYVGSSNMDWRSLTQIQEMGILLTDCPTLVDDLNKVFRVYYLTGQEGRVPSNWPSDFIGGINATHPWTGVIAGFKYSIYIGASPPPLCPPYRSRDIDAILSAVQSAKKFVHVAVMDYEAVLLNYATGQQVFWPAIDNALRAAAFRGVHVRLLVSHWKHSRSSVERFVNSLTAISSYRARIEGKFFIVPTYTDEQAKIPFARVNHNKFMVTDTTAVICTSNWEGSYFTNTAGVAVSITELDRVANEAGESIVSQLQDVFMRDWTSPYAHERPEMPRRTATSAGGRRHARRPPATAFDSLKAKDLL